MRRAATFLAVLGSVLLVAGCPSPPEDLSEQDRARIEQIIDGVAITLRAGDYAMWAGHFAEDAVIYPPNAPSVRGRAVIQRWGEAFPAIEDLTFFDVQVWGEGDYAYGTSGYAFTVEGSPPDTGKQLWAFRRSAGAGWEVVAASYNSDLPVPGRQE